MGAVRERGHEKVEIDIPPDPHTGARVKILDRFDFIHAVCRQIRDRGFHLVHHLGAYSNRKRGGTA